MNILHLRQQISKLCLTLILLCLMILNSSQVLDVKAQLASPPWTFTGALNTARSFHQAVLLLNDKVLIVGGSNTAGGTNPGGGALVSAELYDPITGVWTQTGSLNVARSSSTATLLPSGKVLVTGGSDTTAELYDPATETWTTINPMNVVQVGHTATLLSNGKVLVTGGGLMDASGIKNAELFDPDTGVWSATGMMNKGRWGHTATLLSNGKVLVTGGVDEGRYITSSAELYDPATEIWTVTSSLNLPLHGHTATLLPSGKVLVVGGFFGSALNGAELYDPNTGLWSDEGVLNTPRMQHTAILLPNGEVLVVGGRNGNWGEPQNTILSSMELYNPSTHQWTTIESLNTARTWHTATLLKNNNLLVVGGYDGNIDLASAELYPIPDSVFSDVSIIYWARDYIDRLYKTGITGGCSTSPLSYCPENEVTRAQMAVFLERGLHYPATFTAPNVAPTFNDTVGHWAEDWIEALKNDGITAGCAAGLYCPENPVTRAQMAVFLLKAKYGKNYTPPLVGASTGFGDVATSHWASAWIKQLAAEQITGGCGGGNYCPESPVTRAQMAVFLVKAFNLP